MRNERRKSGSEGGHGKPTAATSHGAHDPPYVRHEVRTFVQVHVHQLVVYRRL